MPARKKLGGKRRSRANVPQDPNDPGYQIVYVLKEILDRLVRSHDGNKSAAARSLGISPGMLAKYRRPAPEGPNLATIGRMASALELDAVRFLCLHPSLSVRAQGRTGHRIAVGLTLPQRERVGVLLHRWIDQDDVDRFLSAAEAITTALETGRPDQAN